MRVGAIRAAMAFAAVLAVAATAGAEERPSKQLRPRPDKASPAENLRLQPQTRAPAGRPRLNKAPAPAGRPGIGCPDLRVMSFKLVEVTPRGGDLYDLTFETWIRNTGPGPYISDSNHEQDLRVMEIRSDGLGVRTAVQIPGNMPLGRSIRPRATFERVFSTQLPEAYEAEILYAAGNARDDNPSNDDCNLENNKAAISGAAVLGQITGQALPRPLPERGFTTKP